MKKKVHTEETQNSLVYLIKKTWRYSEGNRKNIVRFWMLFIAANIVSLFVQPFLWATIMNVIATQGVHTMHSFLLIIKLLGSILVADCLFWSLHGPGRMLERTNAFKSRGNYRRYLLKGVMSLSMDWHNDHTSGDTIDKIEKGTTALYGFSEDTFEIIAPIVQLIGSYCMLIYFCPSASYIVVGMIFVTAWITMRFDKVLISQFVQLNNAENIVSEKVFDAISNIATVITLRAERSILKAIVHKIEEPLELFKKNNKINEIKWFLTNICCTITTILVLGVYFWQHIGVPQGVLVGTVYLVIEYLSKISSLFFKFTGKYGEILQQKAKVMNSEELTKDFVPENFVNHVLPPHWKKLEIKNLTFSYRDEINGRLHLNDVFMSILKGQNIAFIGTTGSGKSTMLKIMRDLHHPTSLTLTVDGQDIPHGFEGISQAISLVPQHSDIFANTVLENITLGANYDMSVVEDVAGITCFTEVVNGLEQKFNTHAKERGGNLSGGQQQRLALTRGLFACYDSDKDIILLDEPTSSLDTVTEKTVYQNIFNEFKDKTIISTIHRLHLLPLFDIIYLFNEGQIVGVGTFNELLSTNAQFQKMWQETLTE